MLTKQLFTAFEWSNVTHIFIVIIIIFNLYIWRFFYVYKYSLYMLVIRKYHK